MAGAVVPFAVRGVAAWSRPGRQLPAGSPLLYGGSYPEPDGEESDHDGNQG